MKNIPFKKLILILLCFFLCNTAEARQWLQRDLLSLNSMEDKEIKENHEKSLYALSDKDLGEITAGSGSIIDFTLGNNIARLDMDLYLELHMEMERFRAGWHDYGADSTGWDQDWENISFGSQDNYFKAYKFSLIAEYGENDEGKKQLVRLLIGSPKVEGRISAKFNSISGSINPALCDDLPADGIVNNLYHRKDIGSQTLNFTGQTQGLFLGLNLDSLKPGFAIFAGKSTNDILQAGKSDWWDLPPGPITP